MYIFAEMILNNLSSGTNFIYFPRQLNPVVTTSDLHTPLTTNTWHVSNSSSGMQATSSNSWIPLPNQPTQQTTLPHPEQHNHNRISIVMQQMFTGKEVLKRGPVACKAPAGLNMNENYGFRLKSSLKYGLQLCPHTVPGISCMTKLCIEIHCPELTQL